MALMGFISYAHDDARMVREFRKHLVAVERALRVQFWYDADLRAGHRWDKEIEEAIERAHVFILLISPGYIASDFIFSKELPAIKARTKAIKGIIFPVVLDHCMWSIISGVWQAIPYWKGQIRPISAWPRTAEGYDIAVTAIHEGIQEYGLFHRSPQEFLSLWDIDSVETPQSIPINMTVTRLPEFMEFAEVAVLPPGPIVIDGVRLQDFKGISTLTTDLTAPSTLSSNWTCFAGINGSGKTSILQALSLVLLGSPLVSEFGRDRLREFWRRIDTSEFRPEITIQCHIGDTRYELYLPFSEEGIDQADLDQRDSEIMTALWRRLQSQLVASYGASRNLSSYRDGRHDGLSRQVRRQMTLFDPSARIANADVLLSSDSAHEPARETFIALMGKLLEETDIGNIVFVPGKGLRFRKQGSPLSPLDLPDGFRSTLAWLADLCSAWHELGPDQSRDPQDITGIVLIDEIDLHLHATLQRRLVPALRKALPNIQFIVTTHSPLVLSCFDRNELVILDQDSPGGIRELDRQIYGMSMNEIYEWLMGTPAESPVIEAMMRDSDSTATALALAQSPSVSEEEAKSQLVRRRAMLRRLHAESARPA